MNSDQIKSGPARAPARAMLRATGMTDADIAKPLIGVVHTWSDISPCNITLRELAGHVREGVRAAGGTPVEFNTIAVTDGIAMGTVGMRASLPSREVIADSIELAVNGHSIGKGRLARLSETGAIEMGSATGARVLLIAGTPLNEPIVQYGPFVMNSREEIEQALRDFRDDRLTA